MPKPHYLDDNVEERSSKKPRFDARNPSTLAPEQPDEDAILDLDEIGKGGLQSKRNAVRLEGYESDSSNENFDARADAKAREAKKTADRDKAGDEEDNDMFADLEEEQFNDADEDEDLAREGKKRKKEVHFMDDGDIQGQINSSKSGGHVPADFSLNNKQSQKEPEEPSSEDDSGAEEERDRIHDGMDEELGAGSKKSHAPRLDAFNMREEAEEGRFDEAGNFVRNAVDPSTAHDSWLAGTSKAEMRKAKAAADKREQDRRDRAVADDAIPLEETLTALISRMMPHETVLETLQRFGASKQKKHPKWQKNKRSKGMQMDIDPEKHSAIEEEMARKKDVEAITAAADRLLTLGQIDIYDQERAMLQRRYQRETGTEWSDGSKAAEEASGEMAAQWEYRWSDGRDGGDAHGPYDEPTMSAWSEAGYFGDGVEYRKVGRKSWTATPDFGT